MTHLYNIIPQTNAIAFSDIMKTPLNHVPVATHYVIYAQTLQTPAAHSVDETVSAQAQHVIATMLIDITIIPYRKNALSAIPYAKCAMAHSAHPVLHAYPYP